MDHAAIRAKQLADIARMREERADHERSFASVRAPATPREGLELDERWQFIPADPDSNYQPEPTRRDREAARLILALDQATALTPEDMDAIDGSIRHRWLQAEIKEKQANEEWEFALDLAATTAN
jgi:hypothetical protein